MGGTYLRLTAGEPTGVNPLQWPVTQKLRAFLPQWVLTLVPSLKPEPAEIADLEAAINIVLGMDWSQRNLTSVYQLLPINGPRGSGNTLRVALARWIRGGPLGWAFDAADDRLPREVTVAGYDYTDFLEHDELRSPMVMALLEYGDSLVDGTPFIQVVAETWRAAKDKAMRKFLHDKAKTIGKLGGLLVMDTQEPGDLVDESDDPNAIGSTLVSQTPTVVCFHDDQSPDAAYLDTLRLTHAELGIVRTLAQRDGRCFLFKQNGQSAIVNFDLSGIGDHLIALSGSEKNVRLLDQVRAEVGDDPEVWWPVLVQRVHERDQKARVHQLPQRKAA
jgi:type IV secretion system protein VirB4